LRQGFFMERIPKPLEGIRVLDLSRYEAGPTCALLLACLGAEVIKVEDLRSAEVQRRLFHNLGERDDLYFVLMNLSKKSVALDLDREEGRSLLRRLLDKVDVLVESLGTRRWAELGMDPAGLRGSHPHLIVASVSAYGSRGPYAFYPAMDMTAQAMGGLMSLTGAEDGVPLRCGGAVADGAGGTYLALGVVSALFRRQRCGLGSHVEVSLQEAAMGMGRSLLGTHMAYGSRAPRTGNRLKDVAPWDVYPAQDGYVALCVIPHAAFCRLMRVVGCEDLIRSLGIRTVEDRVAHREKLDEVIGSWIAPREKREAMRLLAEAGVPCGAVLDSMEIAGDAHVRAGGMLAEVEHPEWGRLTVLGSPVRFVGEDRTLSCCPALGAHTREVLETVLEVSEEELRELKGSGIVSW